MNNKRQRDMLFTMLLLVMALLIPQWGWAQETSQPSVGDGTANNPYIITKAEELAWFRDYVNGVIVDEGEAPGTVHLSASAMLTEDIDLKNYCHAAGDGKELLSWIPIGNAQNRWKGKMYGQKHTISNLYIKSAQDYVGLFGYIENAIIQDIIFNNAQVENVSDTGKKTQYTGILAGYAWYAYNNIYVIKGIRTTTDCKVTGQTNTGGIVGYTEINLERCENHSNVKGTEGVGGIAGKCAGSPTEAINVKYCANYGTVENDKKRIGGIIGLGENINMLNCANYGKITGATWCGGIVGQLSGDNCCIQNVFSYGDVAATDAYGISGIITGYEGGYAKGIIAYNKEALLNNSSENIKVVGSGSLTFDDGKEEADVVKAFTKQQIKSGEVAWLLNGSTSTPAEGSNLSWYQKLGENGDAYPVLNPTGKNTVYGAYYHGEKDRFFSNTVIANQHSVAYNAEAEDEANGNHDLSYEAGEYTWTEAEDKVQAPSVAVTYTCKVCGKTETPQMTIEHNAEHNNEAATCTEEGHNYYKTSYTFNDKAVFSDAYTQTLPALGHNMNEITFDRNEKIYSNQCQREGCGHIGHYATSDGNVEAQLEGGIYKVASFNVADATAYNSEADFTATSLAYRRTFYDDKWMAVYVPFAIDCSKLESDYEMATINNFHEYEQENGTYKVVLEVKRVTKGGTIPALTPCLMRMKTTPEVEVEKTLNFENAEFSAAADKSIDCSSVTRYYQFTGSLNGKTGLNEDTDFVLNEGKIYKTSESTVLLPQRWYLSATDRTSSSVEPVTMLRSISINVIGDGEATGIEDIQVNTELGADAFGGIGIYDLQGRKINCEPTKGMYIKNGKKYIK